MTTAFPLAWPTGWPRTPVDKREDGRSRFGRRDSPWRVEDAYQDLVWEIERARGRAIVVSTNRVLRKDGWPSAAGRAPDDDGVAVYFTRAGKQLAMAQDRFLGAAENMRSLTLAIEAIRALERHGGGVMVERAYDGFAALPAPVSRAWSDVLGVPRTASADAVQAAYKAHARAAAERGDQATLQEINVARDAALAEIARR